MFMELTSVASSCPARSAFRVATGIAPRLITKPLDRVQPSLDYHLARFQPPLFAEALATSFGDRDRILKLDEPAPGMSHRCLDGDDHAGLQRPSCVVGLVRHRSIVNLAWRFMTDEAHAMRRKIQIGSVGRGVQGLVRRPENLGPYGAAADRAACLLLDLLDYAEKVNKLGVWLAQNAIRHKSPI